MLSYVEPRSMLGYVGLKAWSLNRLIMSAMTYPSNSTPNQFGMYLILHWRKNMICCIIQCGCYIPRIISKWHRWKLYDHVLIDIPVNFLNSLFVFFFHYAAAAVCRGHLLPPSRGHYHRHHHSILTLTPPYRPFCHHNTLLRNCFLHSHDRSLIIF